MGAVCHGERDRSSVSNGVVTLSGTVPTYAEKQAAERATQRVQGVKGIAEEITTKLSMPHTRTDAEIAEAAVSSLKSHVWVPPPDSSRPAPSPLCAEQR